MREWEKIIDDSTRIIFKLDPSKWSVAYLFFTGRWECIARIDNYPHEGKQKSHIHRYKQDRVEFRDMTFDEAEKTAINIGNRIKESIKDGIY